MAALTKDIICFVEDTHPLGLLCNYQSSLYIWYLHPSHPPGGFSATLIEVAR